MKMAKQICHKRHDNGWQRLDSLLHEESERALALDKYSQIGIYFQWCGPFLFSPEKQQSGS